MAQVIWKDSVLQLILWGAVLSTVVAIVYYVLKKIRAETLQKESNISDLLSNFREIHSRGGLSEAEFRNIKTKLAARLHRELKDNADKG